MIVVVAITIALGAVLLWALYSEQVPPPARRLVHRWTGVPDAAAIRRTDFPLALAGYDPRAVDAHLHAVADAVARLRDQIDERQVDERQVDERQVDAIQGSPGASGWSMAATPAAPATPPPTEGSPWAPPDLRKGAPGGSVPPPAGDEDQGSSRDDV